MARLNSDAFGASVLAIFGVRSCLTMMPALRPALHFAASLSYAFYANGRYGEHAAMTAESFATRTLDLAQNQVVSQLANFPQMQAAWTSAAIEAYRTALTAAFNQHR